MTALTAPLPAVPAPGSIARLQLAARDCRACDLYADATQTVFGEGPAHAEMMLVGEQPGDLEDRAGRPFVGPAGRLLDRLLETAGIDRASVYVTNAVKHFKWTAAGKRRIHAKPNPRERSACHPWLDAEVLTVRPRIVVCLGATAAQSMLGADFRITRDRGKVRDSRGTAVLATFHPSALLRMRDHDERLEAERTLVLDLRRAHRHAGRAEREDA